MQLICQANFLTDPEAATFVMVWWDVFYDTHLRRAQVICLALDAWWMLRN